MDTTSQTPSGIPYLAYLSGLNLGQGGQSGLTDPSLSGQPAQGGKGGGMAGGLGLDELQQLLMAQQGSDVAGSAGTPFTQGIGALGGFGNIGQGPGYGQAGGVLSGASQGPSQGSQGMVAGQTGGQIDPMAILRQALGLVQKGAGLIPGQSGSYATAGDTGVSLSDQLRSGQAGTASPLYGVIDPLTGLPLPGSQQQPTGGVIPTAGFGETPAGTPGAINQTYINQFLGGNNPSQEFIQQALSAGMSPDQIQGLMSDPEVFARLGGSVGTQPDTSTLSGYSTAGSTTPSTPGTAPTNIGGTIQSGAGTGIGLLNLIQAIQGGNVPGGIAGALQGVGGITGLLGNLGYGSQVGNAIGGAAGGLGGLLGVEQGIEGLVNGGNVGRSLMQLGGGALGAYGGAQSLGLLGGTAGGGISGIIASAAPELASQLASQLGVQVAENATTQVISQALSQALAGVGAAAAPIIAGVLSYISADDLKSAMNSWANLGKPLTMMQERALNAGEQATGMFDTLQRLGITDPNILKQALGAGGNALNTFYDNQMVMGRRFGPLAYYDRTKQDPSQFFDLLNRTKAGELGLVQQFINQGGSLQDLAGIPAARGWGDLMRKGYAGDVSLPTLGKYDLGYQTGLPMGGQAGSAGAASYGTGWLDQPAVNAATGSPFLSMLANVAPEMYTNLGGQMNMNAPLVQEYLANQAQAAAMQDAAAYEAFTSGGG